jgi:soluble lytic murein transglycosylase-like protein
MTQAAIVSLIILYSNIYGVDQKVALAVAEQESHYNPRAIGPVGELGIYQLRPEFNRKFTKKQLLTPEINIALGVYKLKMVKKTCVHKKDIEWLICFNAGDSGAKKIKYPSRFPYVRAVRKLMVARNG